MLARSDQKYARLRRESITVYFPGEGPALPYKRESLDAGQPTDNRRGSKLLQPLQRKPRDTNNPTNDHPQYTNPYLNNNHENNPQKVRINVSGTNVETYVTTLARFPTSLLGDEEKRKKYWDEEREEYILERHVPSFEAVFQFYQTGILHRPVTIPLYTFLEELEFYEFDQHMIDAYKIKEGFLLDKSPDVPDNEIKKAIWLLLEYPRSSRLARLFAFLSITVICLTVVSYCAETMSQFRDLHCHNVSVVNDLGEVLWYEVPNPSNVFFLVETVCVGWFTMELVLRFICCPSKAIFLCNKLNMVDIVTVIPYAVLVIVITVTQSCYIAKRSASILIFRILRMFRLFKLTKHFRALQIFVLCLRHSVRELRLFLFLVIVGCVLLAVAVYVAEVDHPDSMIDSIPEGIWWAIATMTTVGYGDVYPVGIYGKLVGVICFITGCLVVALPTPPIVSNFNHFYRIETGRNCDETV